VAVIGRAGSAEGSPLALPNISSTEVRRLAEAGAWDEVAELVPARVLRRLRRSQSGGAS
jgi:citrate lyase synthetase